MLSIIFMLLIMFTLKLIMGFVLIFPYHPNYVSILTFNQKAIVPILLALNLIHPGTICRVLRTHAKLYLSPILHFNWLLYKEYINITLLVNYCQSCIFRGYISITLLVDYRQSCILKGYISITLLVDYR